MLGWAFAFLLMATVAAVYGYSGTPSTSIYIAKLVFFLFLFIFFMLLILSLFSTAPPPLDTTKMPM